VETAKDYNANTNAVVKAIYDGMFNALGLVE
jgi:hypothetical protein